MISIDVLISNATMHMRPINLKRDEMKLKTILIMINEYV